MKKLLTALLVATALGAYAQGTKHVGNFHGNGAGLTGIVASVSGASPITAYGQSRVLSNRFDIINVKDFGARGNGSTDDYIAVQTAVNMTTNLLGRGVYFPAGTYRMTNTLRCPPAGTTITNDVVMFGDSQFNTFLSFVNVTNGNGIEMVTSEGSREGSLVIRDLSLRGPFYNSVFGFNPNSEPFQTVAQVPFRGAGIFMGMPGVFGTDMTMLHSRIERVQVWGFFNGIVCSNIGLTKIESADLIRNAWSGMLFAHCDTVEDNNSRIATMTITNRDTFTGDSPYLYRFVGTGLPGELSVDGEPAADVGVNKIIRGGEHWGPAVWADGARLLVEGGQWEDYAYGMIVHSNGGWCYLTNKGNYRFKGLSIKLPLDIAPNAEGISRTNHNIFSCWNQAGDGLIVEDCSLPRDQDMNPAQNSLPRLFDLNGTNLIAPYWNHAKTGPYAGQDQETYLNTRWNKTNYLHIRQRRADSLNIASFQRNGRRIERLKWADGADASGQFLGNVAYAQGPFKSRLLTAFNDAADLYDGYGVSWLGLTTPARWYFEPFVPLPNLDGSPPRNYRITIPILATNSFSTTAGFTVFSRTSSGGNSQLADGTGAYTYSSTTTNVQLYVQTVTLGEMPPTNGAVSVSFAITASAPTVQFWTFNPHIEYW